MHRSRTRHFVDKSVQGAIVARLVVHWLVFCLLAGGLLFFIEMLAGAPRDVSRNLVNRHGPTALAVLVLAPIFILDLVKLSNRFAGPMTRLRRALHELADGKDVSPIEFREGDFWRELASDLNRT